MIFGGRVSARAEAASNAPAVAVLRKARRFSMGNEPCFSAANVRRLPVKNARRLPAKINSTSYTIVQTDLPSLRYVP